MKGNSTVGEVIFSFPTDLNLHFKGKQGEGQRTLVLNLMGTAGVLVFQHGVESDLLLPLLTWLLLLGLELVRIPALFWNTEALSLLFSFSQALVTPVTLRPEILGGNQLVIIVGIICATILLLPVLILIVKRTYGNKRYRAAPISWAGGLEMPLA